MHETGKLAVSDQVCDKTYDMRLATQTSLNDRSRQSISTSTPVISESDSASRAPVPKNIQADP